MDELEEDGGFSVRGGAFSLLGPISKGSVGSPDAVTEDDDALAAFDKTLEQQPDDPDQLEAEELWEEAFEEEPLEEPLEEPPGEEVTGPSLCTGGGKGAWKGHSPGLGTMPEPDFEEEEEVEVEVEVEVEEEEEEEVLEEEPPIVTQSSSFKVASDTAPVKAKDSSSDGPPKGTAGTAGSWSNESKLEEEKPAEEKVEDEETDDDDEEEIGISKGKAWLKGKGREMDKSKGKGSVDKGKSWGSSSSEWSSKGWKGEDWWRPSWWGKGDWGKGLVSKLLFEGVVVASVGRLTFRWLPPQEIGAEEIGARVNGMVTGAKAKCRTGQAKLSATYPRSAMNASAGRGSTRPCHPRHHPHKDRGRSQSKSPA